MDSVGLFITIFFSHMLIHATVMKSKTPNSPLIIGLNPALQRTLTVSNLQLGNVNRASNVKVGIGGKGQNACVAAKCMKSIIKPTLLQFLGNGFEGDAVSNMLETIVDHQISVRTKGRCRVCVTLLNREESTEIIEPSEELSMEEISNLINTTKSYYNLHKPSGVAIMGSMPKPCPPTLYSELLANICNDNTKVLLDTISGLFDSIYVCLQKSSSCIIKLNTNELCSLTGINYIKNQATESSVVLQASNELINQLFQHIKSQQIENNLLLRFPPVLAIAVTDGPFPAHLITFRDMESRTITPTVDTSNGNTMNDIQQRLKTNQWLFKIPKLPRSLVSPIGAGDATSSGTLMQWCNQIQQPCTTTIVSTSTTDSNKLIIKEEEQKVVTSFQWGLSCGAASCMSASNSMFEVDDAVTIFNQIQVTKM